MNGHPGKSPRRLLGTLTIGQAPRPDITPILESCLPPDTDCVHAGVLDGLDPRRIAQRFAVRDGQPVLVSRLLDGTHVTLDKATVRQAMQPRLDELDARGCDAVLVLCTGEFHDLKLSHAWLIEPDRLVPPAVAALAGSRQVGVIVPLAEQAVSEAGKFSVLARPPLCEVALPYGGDTDAVARAALALRDRGAEILVLDCMGFVRAHQQAARQACGLPVLLSNAVVAKLTSELIA